MIVTVRDPDILSNLDPGQKVLVEKFLLLQLNCYQAIKP